MNGYNKISDMEKGPWQLYYDEGNPYLVSDDFEHDVLLRISGDFSDHKQKTDYMEKFRDFLNNAKLGQRK